VFLRTILHWTFTGVVHALLVFMIPFLTLAGTGIDYEHGRATDIWVIGNTVLFISITVVNGKLILLSSSLNWVSLLGFSFSLVTYVILCPIFNHAADIFAGGWEVFGVFTRITECPSVYPVVLATLTIAFGWQAGIAVLRYNHCPTLLQEIQTKINYGR